MPEPKIALTPTKAISLAREDVEENSYRSGLSVSSVSADTTIDSWQVPRTATSHVGMFNVDCTAADIDMDLPPAADNPGRIIVLRKSDASGNSVNINPDGSETINGAALSAIAGQYLRQRLVSDGVSEWMQA